VLLKMECDITPFGCHCDADGTDVMGDEALSRENVTAVGSIWLRISLIRPFNDQRIEVSFAGRDRIAKERIGSMLH
jgi:hypothetical protein